MSLSVPLQGHFGSLSRGNYSETSDIDVRVVMKEGSLIKFVRQTFVSASGFGHFYFCFQWICMRSIRKRFGGKCELMKFLYLSGTRRGF
jgi:hypothetical protein